MLVSFFFFGGGHASQTRQQSQSRNCIIYVCIKIISGNLGRNKNGGTKPSFIVFKQTVLTKKMQTKFIIQETHNGLTNKIKGQIERHMDSIIISNSYVGMERRGEVATTI
jgi:hypothetical protein